MRADMVEVICIELRRSVRSELHTFAAGLPSVALLLEKFC